MWPPIGIMAVVASTNPARKKGDVHGRFLRRTAPPFHRFHASGAARRPPELGTSYSVRVLVDRRAPASHGRGTRDAHGRELLGICAGSAGAGTRHRDLCRGYVEGGSPGRLLRRGRVQRVVLVPRSPFQRIFP